MKVTQLNYLFIRIITGFILFFNIQVSAQVNLMWTVDYFGAPPSNWGYNSASVDQDGNTYVVNYYGNNQQDSIFLLKYSPEGNLIWNKLLISENTTMIFYHMVNLYIDSLNYPIINLQVDSGANDHNDFIKCDTAGTILWQFSIAGHLPVTAAVDLNNNLYVTYHRGTDSSMVIEKYDPTGTLLYQASTSFWSGSYGKPPVVDNSGNAWFGFNLISATNDTAKWYKVNQSGLISDSLIFVDGWQGPMIFDQLGNMYVGFHYQYPQNMNFYDSTKTVVRKYDSTMNLLWDTGPTDMYRIEDLEVDASGNVYGLGYYGSGMIEMRVGKFDASGNPVFINSFGLNLNGLSNFMYGELILDASGNPCAIGKYYPNGFTVSSISYEFFIRRLNASGVMLDMELFQDPGGNNDLEFCRANGNNLFVMVGGSVHAKINRLCIDCPATISGTVYFDADSSCTLNGSEHGLNDMLVSTVPGSLFMNTDVSGFYHGFLNDNNYDVVFAPYLSYNHTCSTDTINIQIINGTPVTQVNSGMYLSPSLHDMQLIQAHGSSRPGFNTLYGIKYTNGGGSVQSGTLDFVHDSLFAFVQSTPPPDAILGDTLRWNFTGLLQGLAEEIFVTLQTPAPTTVGTPFVNEFFITGNSPESTPGDNMVIDSGLVTGSFDPNEKTAHPAGLGPQGFITPGDSAILYTIHFENIGNDTAFTVLVIDTLDSDLDITSFRIGVASHPFTWRLVDGHILWFRFENILLADSSNPDENKGFISYSIKQLPGLLSGTEIHNSADIFFDYNLPVRTNQTLHTIFNPVGLNDPNDQVEVSLYPNPVNELLFINPGILKIKEINIFDMQGKLLHVPVSAIETTPVLDFGNIKHGIYLIKIKTNAGWKYAKIARM